MEAARTSGLGELLHPAWSVREADLLSDEARCQSSVYDVVIKLSIMQVHLKPQGRLAHDASRLLVGRLCMGHSSTGA